MAELAVAAVGVFLSPLLGVAIDRISKSQTFIEFFKVEKGIKFDEEVLDRLKITLYAISDVLEDAQVKEGAEAVRTWLGKVRAEVNHADDLLDEFNTECLRLQLLGDGLLDQLLHKQTQPDLKVHRFRFPFRKQKKTPEYTHGTLFIEELMPNLEEVTARLEGFEKQIQRLGLQKLDSKEKLPHREPSSSVVDKSQFFARDDEKEKMIKMVLSGGGVEDVSVIAITGMGGIGKTTLAQLVYNDDRVKEKFQTRAWVCVSEDYDALRITKAILMEVNSAVLDDKDDFNRLQVKLKENLAGKSFLIILDDIWNKNTNDWSILKTPLSYGSRGSKIIVTTRNEEVALTMQTEPFHQLKPMPEGFEKQIQRLGLQKLDSKEKLPHREPSSSVVDKSQLFGRDDEKEKMIKMVLSGGGVADVSVVAITGMGGIGKTTLAQLVYNDDRVKEKFQTRAWVCVSEDYDALRITKAILMEVNSAVLDDKDDFNSLQVKLKEYLAGKCFLIILDDIWNENSNDWSKLKTPLSYGSKGSKIIVTTRNEKVAHMMQNEPLHHLLPMREDQSWSLFKRQAFENGDHAPLHEFERIGKEIVKKCKGLPLAIKMTAGALRRQRDINLWQDFLSSEDWAVGGDILPALSLSYKHLPSHLKACFAFCALFHKDVPFDKNEVVLLWMANDLVNPSTQKVGGNYFEELKSRSFFESVNEENYLMQNLINDLARSVSENTCVRQEDYKATGLQRENEIPPELLHFSYLSTYNETSERFSRLAQARDLRTFLPIHQYQSNGRNLTTTFFSDILSRFQRLRALNLSQYRISVVPDSIGGLKHLRFLNLASTDITKLPNTIGKCLNLETLILENCKKLIELPEEMGFLINLQHLDVRGLGDQFIRKMATWLSIFEDIQNVSVVVDKIHGIDLKLLVQLQLCHSLDIIGLGDTDVATIERAVSAGLIDKVCIENLSLEWSGRAESQEDELSKFVKLQPHTNTKQLRIKGYTGTRFPEWLGDSAFSNIESLSLINCNKCFSLPPLGQLTGLKKLYISGMDGITEIGNEFYGDASTSKPFQALEELKFSDMAEWAIWNTHWDLDFSSLKSFKIENCPKLVSELPCGDSSEPIPLFSLSKLQEVRIENWGGLNLFNRNHQTLTSLQFLEIKKCNNILSFPEGGLAAPNLKRLYVRDCWKMKSLPARMDTQLPMLTELTITNCPEIECFPEGGLPTSLETLQIWDCSKMRNCRTSWGLQALPSLKEVKLSGFEDTLFPEEKLLPASLLKLTIWEFPNMESLNEKGLEHLRSLQSLTIVDCPTLKYLPEEKFSSSLSDMTIHDCKLIESFPEGLASSLSTLIIWDCPKLAASIEREKGEDLPNVSHIPEIRIW